MNETTYANSIFEQPWWLDIVAQGKWGESLVKDGDEIIARLPYVLEKNKIVMPPLTQTLGPWIAPKYREFQVGNSQLTRQKEIISELLAGLPKHKSFYMCFDNSNEYILPYRWHGYRYEPTFSYRLKDISNMSEKYDLFHKTVKKNIKSAINKTSVYDMLDVGVLINMLDKTFEAQNRKNPLPIDIIKNIVTTCEMTGHGKYLEAKDAGGNVHSCAYFIYDEKVCYYLLGATDSKFRSSGAQSLVLWEGMKFASKHSATFDFEGSNIEGIENFFRQFGGERVVNYSVSKQSFFEDFKDILKPRIKKILGYKN